MTKSMNDHDFEQQLRQQPLRPMPPAWRREILAAQRPSELSLTIWLRQLLWPHPAAWATLAAAWVLIMGLNFLSRETFHRPAINAELETQAQRLALAEQRRLWLELIEPAPSTAAPSKHGRPSPEVSPRSERQIEIGLV
jgi:hypothetical protein